MAPKGSLQSWPLGFCHRESKWPPEILKLKDLTGLNEVEHPGQHASECLWPQDLGSGGSKVQVKHGLESQGWDKASTNALPAAAKGKIWFRPNGCRLPPFPFLSKPWKTLFSVEVGRHTYTMKRTSWCWWKWMGEENPEARCGRVLWTGAGCKPPWVTVYQATCQQWRRCQFSFTLLEYDKGLPAFPHMTLRTQTHL